MNEVINERGMVPRLEQVPGSSLYSVPRRILPVVLGMHRSSTSLTAGVLHRLGIDMTDGDLKANEFNKGGYYERFSLVELHDQVLKSFGSRWDSLTPLPPGWWRDPPALAARSEIVNRLKAELPESPQRLWGLKDPRLMRLLPLWLDVCTDLHLEPRIILVTRDPDEVAASLNRRDGMSREDALVLWSVLHMEFLQHVGDTPWVRVDCGHWLDDHRAHAARLMHFLGAPSVPRDNAMLAVDEWLNPEWMSSARPGRRSRSFAHWLYDCLAGLPDVDGESGVEISSELRRSAQNFHVFARAFRPVFQKAERLPSAETAVRIAEDTVSERDAVVAELRAQLTEIQSRLSETAAQRDGAWQEIVVLRDKLAEFQSKSEAQDTVMKTAAAECERLSARIGQLETALAEVRAERDSSRDQLEASGREAASLGARIIQLETALAEVRAERDTSRDQLEASGREAASLGARISQLETALAEVQAERDSARDQLEASGKEAASLGARIGQLETTLAEVRAERDSARDQLEASGKEAASLGARISQLETALAEVRAERDSARDQLEASSKEAASLGARIGQLETTLAEVQAERDSSRDQLEASSKEAASLGARIGQLETTLAEVQAERDSSRDQL
ncbi:hypothetical protein, partial [Azospirillum sp. RU37A]